MESYKVPNTQTRHSKFKGENFSIMPYQYIHVNHYLEESLLKFIYNRKGHHWVSCSPAEM